MSLWDQRMKKKASIHYIKFSKKKKKFKKKVFELWMPAIYQSEGYYSIDHSRSSTNIFHPIGGWTIEKKRALLCCTQCELVRCSCWAVHARACYCAAVRLRTRTVVLGKEINAVDREGSQHAWLGCMQPEPSAPKFPHLHAPHVGQLQTCGCSAISSPHVHACGCECYQLILLFLYTICICIYISSTFILLNFLLLVKK